MKLNVNNEYSILKRVLLGPVEDKYLDEILELKEILKKYSIKIEESKYDKNSKYQMFVRDPFIVIKDKILLCPMKEDFRREELNTINDLLKKINSNSIIKVPKNVYLEGGDVILYNDTIFVGINGGRTNMKGVEFLKKTFPKHNIVPLKMYNPDKNIPWVHLDCLFNILSNDTILIYKNGFLQETLDVLNHYFSMLIPITKKEQEELACNVISLGDNTVVMQKRHKRLIEILKKNNFKIELMKYYNTIDEVGYLRCLTCPLERK